VYLLHKLTDEGKLPRFPIYVDSPLATDLTAVFTKYRADFDAETKADFARDPQGPLAFSNLTYTHSIEESKELNERPGPYIVISAAGMMTAGRVVHHLRHSITDARNAVLITGYQAEGTPGRQLVEGARYLDLHGETFPVKAEVVIF